MDEQHLNLQTEKGHLKHLELVFDKVKEASIKLNMSKYKFFKKGIKYLGHLVSGEGTSPMKQKIKAIIDLAPTTNVTQARHIIGLEGYYRKYIPICSDTIKPLNELTKKNASFKWMDQCQKRFRVHKTGYYNKPHFNLPRPQ